MSNSIISIINNKWKSSQLRPDWGRELFIVSVSQVTDPCLRDFLFATSSGLKGLSEDKIGSIQENGFLLLIPVLSEQRVLVGSLTEELTSKY